MTFGQRANFGGLVAFGQMEGGSCRRSGGGERADFATKFMRQPKRAFRALALQGCDHTTARECERCLPNATHKSESSAVPVLT